MVEALELSGFQIVECRSKFLPYTIKRQRFPALVLAQALSGPTADPMATGQANVPCREAERMMDNTISQVDFVMPVFNEGDNIARAP